MKLTDISIRRVPTVDPTDTLEEAARVMRKAGLDLLPVVESGRLVGVLNERDILSRDNAEKADQPPVRVAGICRRDPLVCAKSVHLKTALQLMRQHRQSWLLVTERDGTLAGLITPMELIDLLIERVPEESDGPEMESVHRVRGDYGTAL